jgi:hypothetical protein
MESKMARKTLVFGGLVAAAVVAGGMAMAQPFGMGPGGGRPGMGPRMMQADADGHGFAGRMGPGMGMMGGGSRMGMGPGMMGMHGAGGADAATPSEMGDIHQLFAEHRSIRREVTNLPNGIRTVTESDDPRLAEVIRTHVVEMGQRVEQGRDPRLPIQSAELRFLFEARDRIASTYERTDRGIVVVQTSEDPAVVAALQKHAADVSDLAARGMVAAHEAMMRNSGMMRGARR